MGHYLCCMFPLPSRLRYRLCRVFPALDPGALITQFLTTYFGQAGVHIRRYMDLLHESAAAVKYFMHEGIPPDASFLTPTVVLEAEAAFVEAEAAVAASAMLLARVQKARMPIDFVMLERWAELRGAAIQAGTAWPLAATQAEAFQSFVDVAAASGVTRIRESGCSSIVPCLQEEILLAPYPLPAPRPSPKAPAWVFEKCDVSLDSAGVGQCRCSSAPSSATLRLPWEAEHAKPLVLPPSKKTSSLSLPPSKNNSLPASVYPCPPCCDHGFELYGMDWHQCTSKSCQIKAHSGRCLTADGPGLSFSPCQEDNEEDSFIAQQRFKFDEHSQYLRPASASLSFLCVGVPVAEAGSAVSLSPCGAQTRWKWDRTSAPQDNGTSLRLDTVGQKPAQADALGLCLHEAEPETIPQPLQVHDCIYEDPSLLFTLLSSGQLIWRQDPTQCLTASPTSDHPAPLGELQLRVCQPGTLGQRFEYKQSTNQWHPMGRPDVCLTAAGGTEGRRRLQTTPGAILDHCNGTSTIWQIKPGPRGTAAANLVCFAGECTQPACLGARPNLGGSHAGLHFTPIGPPVAVTRTTGNFLLFPGWA